MRVLLASLALASAADHAPVPCDDTPMPSQCKQVQNSLITGGVQGPAAACTTCTKDTITCGIWQSPGYAEFPGGICASMLSLASHGIVDLSVGPFAGSPATG